MEVTNELEIRMLVTNRKIRMFKNIMDEQRKLGADEAMLQPSKEMCAILQEELQTLIAQLQTAELA